MKRKLLTLIMAASMCALSLIGCSSTETENQNPLNKLSYTCPTSGIEVNASDVSDTGMTLTYTWPGHDANHSFDVSGTYEIEEWDGDEWITRGLKNAVSSSGDSFRVTGDGLFEDKLDWAASYGELPQGRYRLSKTIDFNNSDTEIFYIQFVVE